MCWNYSSKVDIDIKFWSWNNFDETNKMSANQWTGFYTTEICFMKELILIYYRFRFPTSLSDITKAQ